MSIFIPKIRRFLLLAIFAFAYLVPAAQVTAQNSVGLDPSALPVPSEITAGFVKTGVSIRWADASASKSVFINYNIFRYDALDPNKVVKKIAAVPRSTKSYRRFITYIDTSVLPGHKYIYFMTTIDAFANQSNNTRLFYPR